MNLHIRPIKEKDLGKLSEIFTATYSAFDVGERWTPESTQVMLRYCLKKAPDLCFIAEEKKEPLGAFFVGIKPWWDGNHLIDGEIFVHPDHQRKGIGPELLKHVFEYAIKHYNVVRWDTYTFRGKYPLKWYKSLGFEEINEWTMISADPRKVLKKLKG